MAYAWKVVSRGKGNTQLEGATLHLVNEPVHPTSPPFGHIHDSAFVNLKIWLIENFWSHYGPKIAKELF